MMLVSCVLQERCEQERKETTRVTALYARMEEEYRLALLSLGRDRERLEGVVTSLQGHLADARYEQAVRLEHKLKRKILEVCAKNVKGKLRYTTIITDKNEWQTRCAFLQSALLVTWIGRYILNESP